MRKFLGNYNDTYLPKFSAELAGLKTDYRQLVDAKIQCLKQDPWHNTVLMKGQYKGRRKIRINDSDRLVFIICEECVEDGFQKIFRCGDCDQTPENTLIFTGIILEHDYKGNTRW
jgi:hypothetical protein